MSNNTASAYKINQRLKLLETDLNDYRAALDHSIVNLSIAKWVTFILYFTAVWTLYVYDVWGVADFLSSNMGDAPAFIIFGTVSVMLPRFLSRTKEDRYKDIAETTASGYRLNIVAILTLIFFACSGLFFELFTATSQQQHITTTAAENSQSFKQTESTITIASTSGSELAAAERRVALCYAKKEKTCVGDEARANSLREQQARDAQQQIAASTALFAEQHKAREELKEDANKPLFKMIRDTFDVTINTGMIIGVAIMITIFELTHIINLFTYASRLRRWRETNNELIEMNGEYMELTGHIVSSDDFDDMKKPVSRQPMQPAMPQDFKKPSQSAAPIKSPAFNDTATALNNRPTPSSISSTIKTIVNGVDLSKANTSGDIKKAVYNAYSVIPNPAPLNDTDLDKVAEKITQDRGIQPPAIAVEQHPAPAPKKVSFGMIPERPSNQYISGTGINNPVLGKAEAIYPLPLPTADMVKNDAVQQSGTDGGTDGTDRSVPNATERNAMERVGTGEIEAFHSVPIRSVEKGGSVPSTAEEGDTAKNDTENFERMRKVFEENELLETGREVFCPVCTVPFLKKRSNQRFCCAEDKAHYWKLAKRNGYRGKERDGTDGGTD
jgi:hypothetical protein